MCMFNSVMSPIILIHASHFVIIIVFALPGGFWSTMQSRSSLVSSYSLQFGHEAAPRFHCSLCSPQLQTCRKISRVCKQPVGSKSMTNCVIYTVGRLLPIYVSPNSCYPHQLFLTRICICGSRSKNPVPKALQSKSLPGQKPPKTKWPSVQQGPEKNCPP